MRLFALQANQVPSASRRPITETEREEFFDNLERNNKAGYGLVKLSKLQLDQLFDPPPDLRWNKTATLLTCAVARHRDAIAGFLLRAGVAARLASKHSLCDARY